MRNAFTAAIAIKPNSAYLWLNLASSYAQLEMWSECVSSLEVALALNPDSTEMLDTRALAMYYLGVKSRLVINTFNEQFWFFLLPFLECSDRGEML